MPELTKSFSFTPQLLSVEEPPSNMNSLESKCVLWIKNGKNLKLSQHLKTYNSFNSNHVRLISSDPPNYMCTATGYASNAKGPDRILSADAFTTTQPDGAVKIRINGHPSSRNPPKSVWSMIQETVKRAPNQTALAVKRDGVWVKWTYAEYEKEIRTVAKAFIKLGLKPHYSVGIIGHNAPEWHISNIAAIIAGGLATGIYATNSPDAVKYVAKHSRANLMVVEDEVQLKKVQLVQDDLDNLEGIIQYTGEPTHPGVVSWKELLKIGNTVSDSVLTMRLENQAVNQPCMVVYTSGTTGNPKGVMLSQDNITWIIQVSQDPFNWSFDKEHAVSYLPLSHIAAQVIDIYLTYFGGATVCFADKDALQGSLLKTLLEVRPTRFIGVPRVYEKIQEKMMEIGRTKNKGFKKKVSDWAKSVSLDHHNEIMNGGAGNSFEFRLVQKLILSKVHQRMGLDRAAHPSHGGLYSGAAPLSIQTFQYFQSLDLPIKELLGSSETCGPQTACLPGIGTRIGSVGKCFPQFDTRILNPEQDGVGEIITKGRQICLGYLWDKEKTDELIDSDGWVHSGDLGRVDTDGFFYVSGRMKEIIITAGGENIAPVPIEECIKAEMEDIISNAMVVGDKRKHLAAIITLKTVVDEKNQPTSILHENVKRWLKRTGSKAQTAQEVIEENNERVYAEISEGIDRANQFAISKAHRVQKFLIAPSDFSLDSGELTPTLKIKRHFIVTKYSKDIEKLYMSDSEHHIEQLEEPEAEPENEPEDGKISNMRRASV